MARVTKAGKSRCEYLEDNARWVEFRDKLAERGVTIRWHWQAKSGPDKRHPDIHCCGFVGADFTPSIGMAIVVDYCVGSPIDRQMGFELFSGCGDGTIAANVDAICKPLAKPAHVASQPAWGYGDKRDS